MSQPSSSDHGRTKWGCIWGYVLPVFGLIATIAAPLATLAIVLPIGNVSVVKPSGFGVIRAPDGDYKSDRLVLPVEWNNPTGASTIITRPRLEIHELEEISQESSGDQQYASTVDENEEGARKSIKKWCFVLAGEYPDLSQESLSEPHIHKNAVSIEPQTTSSNVLVFHAKRWWDSKSPGRTFQFEPNEHYRIYLDYVQVPRERRLRGFLKKEALLQHEALFAENPLKMVPAVEDKLGPGDFDFYGLAEHEGVDFIDESSGSSNEGKYSAFCDDGNRVVP